MENQTFSGANIDKKSVVRNMQLWLASNPVLHNPVALSGVWIVDCVNGLLVYFLTETKKLTVAHYFFGAILAGFIFIFGWLTIVLFKACKYEFQVFLIQKRTDLDDVIHNYRNRPEEAKNTAARHLKERVHRTFSLFKGNGGGASPIEIPTVDPAPNVIIQEEPKQELAIALIQDDKDFNFKIDGEGGIISWKQIAKWYSEAHTAYKKNNTPSAKERFNEKCKLYLAARSLKNDEITRRFVEKLALKTYDDRVQCYFKCVPRDIDSSLCEPHKLVGMLSACRKYMNMYIKCIESKQALPDPAMYHVEHYDKIEWAFFNEGTSTTAGCIYKIEKA